MTHWYTEALAEAPAEGPGEPKAELEPAPAAPPQDQTTGPTQDAPQAEGESLIPFSQALIFLYGHKEILHFW